VLGAGGSSIALTSYLMEPRHGDNVPAQIIVTNRSLGRLNEIRAIHEKLGRPVKVEYRHTPHAADNDAMVDALPPHSLVANATGLGKDAPGSPITDAARFPERGYAWDFNYRGDLLFLQQARAQVESRRLHIEDGWTYFIHGWARVIAEVFNIDIPESGPAFEKLSEIAADTRR
jgi:shikimate 5-dehydrogenase